MYILYYTYLRISTKYDSRRVVSRVIIIQRRRLSTDVDKLRSSDFKDNKEDKEDYVLGDRHLSLTLDYLSLTHSISSTSLYSQIWLI